VNVSEDDGDFLTSFKNFFMVFILVRRPLFSDINDQAFLVGSAPGTLDIHTQTVILYDAIFSD